MIGCVVGIRDDQHIILLGFGPHGVIADDDLPVAAPIVPADQDGLALRQCLTDIIQREDLVDLLARVKRGVDIKAAHTLKHLDHAAGGGRAGGQSVFAEGRQGLFIVVAQLAVPVQHHQHAADAAAPLGGLLLGLEVGQDGQGVRIFHMIEVRVTEVRALLMVACPLNAVRAVFRAQVNRVGDLHLIRISG